MPTSQTRGIYLALITAAISGLAVFVNKFAVDIISPPLVFTAAKNTGVGVLVFVILIASGKWAQIKKLTKRETAYLLAIGFIGGAVPFYFFFTGLSQVPAVNAALIHKTLVLWVALLALPTLKEKLSATQIFAVLILFAGNLLVGGFRGFQFSRGELFVLLATILWAAENIFAKKILPSVDPDLVTAARMGIGSVVLLAAAAMTTPRAFGKILTLNSIQVFWLVLTVITLLGYVMTWYRALKLAPITTVTSVLVASTLVTNALSAVFVTHVWTVTMLIQAGLMTTGIGILWFSARSKDINSMEHGSLQLGHYLSCPKR